MATFTEEKRAHVRESLRTTGRERFARYGVRKTTIAELTEPAGIAAGTFYQFYDSKEDLYIDILEQYQAELIPQLLRNPIEKYDDPELAITALLEETLAEFESNPLLWQIIAENEVGYLREHISDEELSEKRASAIGFFLAYIEHWYKEVKITGSDPESIAQTIPLVGRIGQQKEQIGEAQYPNVRDTLISAVVAGLTRDTGSPEVTNG